MSQSSDSVKSGLNISEKIWKSLTNKKIYFGHMSVGYNIIDGMNLIIKENKLEGLKIVDTNKIEDFNSPIFGHSKIGINTDPKSKIDAFVASMNNGLGNKVDIAFIKLCYVDIVSATDIDKVFNYYKENMNELKKKYPKVKFIHFTVPLTTNKPASIKEKLKDTVKSVIGRETNETKNKKDNVARSKYNKILRSTYDKNTLFDLADIESKSTGGVKEVFSFNGSEYVSLSPEYTDDGGHLNRKGRIRAAGEFLEFLFRVK